MRSSAVCRDGLIKALRLLRSSVAGLLGSHPGHPYSTGPADGGAFFRAPQNLRASPNGYEHKRAATRPGAGPLRHRRQPDRDRPQVTRDVKPATECRIWYCRNVTAIEFQRSHCCGESGRPISSDRHANPNLAPVLSRGFSLTGCRLPQDTESHRRGTSKRI
jgi:hypothetical protein